jgi:hypothetical protein
MRFASHDQENAAAAMPSAAVIEEYAALMMTIRLRIFGFKNNLLTQREIAGGPSKGRRQIVAGGA